MAEKYKLAAKKRENVKQSARDTRDAGNIPAVVYGHGVDPIALAIDYSDFLRLFRKTGKAALIDLDVEGKSISVLVHAYNLHPVKDTFQDIDFLAVNLKETTMVHVPIIFHGESEAVKTLGGTFMLNHEELLIRCLPSDIPHDIKVDIAAMEELHDHITIADLKLAETLEVMHLDIETPICSVVGRMADEKEEDVVANVDVSAEAETEA